MPGMKVSTFWPADRVCRMCSSACDTIGDPLVWLLPYSPPEGRGDLSPEPLFPDTSTCTTSGLGPWDFVSPFVPSDEANSSISATNSSMFGGATGTNLSSSISSHGVSTIMSSSSSLTRSTIEDLPQVLLRFLLLDHTPFLPFPSPESTSACTASRRATFLAGAAVRWPGLAAR